MSVHHAPPVSYPVGRSHWVARWVLGLAALAAAVQFVWLGHGARAGWGALAWLLAASGAWLSWRRRPQGRLGWDGQGWAWQSVAYPLGTTVSAPEVRLDLQRVMLLRMSNPAGTDWLVWADAAADPGHWPDFRRAVHARPHNAGVASALPGPSAPP